MEVIVAKHVMRPTSLHDCPFYNERSWRESFCNWKKIDGRAFLECTGLEGPGCPLRCGSAEVVVGESKQMELER